MGLPTSPILLLFLFLLLRTAAASKNTYIVHMSPSMSLDDESIPSPKWYYHHILPHISALQSDPLQEDDVLYAYSNAMTGFAATLTDSQLAALRQSKDFVAAYKDELYTLHTTYTPHFMGLPGPSGVWAAHGDAPDVVIGVLDTGIWPEHPSFSGPGAGVDRKPPPGWHGVCESGTEFNASHCNGKLIGARFFLSGYESTFGRVSSSAEYRSPRDHNGHGTHTASTAAGAAVEDASVFGYASGIASGMAPGARVAAYKVCWSGSCATSDIVAAMDAALADGVHLFSLSFGPGPSSRPFYADATAIAAFRSSARRGVPVVFSAGNSGPSYATVSNGSPWVTTVAASSVDRSFPALVVFGNGFIVAGDAIYRGEPAPVHAPMVYGSFCRTGSFNTTIVSGKIVVCRQGQGTPVTMGVAVRAAGGVGMVLLAGTDSGEGVVVAAHVLPTVCVGAAATKAVRRYVLANDKATGSIILGGTAYHLWPAPALTAFSSRGPNRPSPQVLKPDLTAPGLNILAAWPANLSPTRESSDSRRVTFNVDAGTSMSCPHVAGLTALVRSKRPEWSPAAIKSALMTTAYVTDSSGGEILDFYSGDAATPYGIGAGHVAPAGAFDPGLVYNAGEEDYVEYLCALGYSSYFVRLITGTPVTCPQKLGNASDLNYPSMAALMRGGGGTVVLRRKVTNVGCAESSYVAEVKEDVGMRVSVNPRRLVFTKTNQQLTFTVTVTVVGAEDGDDLFGSVTWVSAEYSVRSPIAVIVLPASSDILERTQNVAFGTECPATE